MQRRWLLAIVAAGFSVAYFQHRRNEGPELDGSQAAQSKSARLPVDSKAAQARTAFPSRNPASHAPSTATAEAALKVAVYATLPVQLRDRLDLKVTGIDSDFAKFVWLLDKVPVENSDERWTLDPQNKKFKLDLRSASWAELSAAGRFPALSDAEIKSIVEEQLGHANHKLLNVIGNPHAMWVRRGNESRLFPVYEVTFQAKGESDERVDEIWRIDPVARAVENRAPQSRHGGAASLGITLKSADPPEL